MISERFRKGGVRRRRKNRLRRQKTLKNVEFWARRRRFFFDYGFIRTPPLFVPKILYRGGVLKARTHRPSNKLWDVYQRRECAEYLYIWYYYVLRKKRFCVKLNFFFISDYGVGSTGASWRQLCHRKLAPTGAADTVENNASEFHDFFIWYQKKIIVHQRYR